MISFSEEGGGGENINDANISKTNVEMIKAMEHPKYAGLFKLLSMTKNLEMVKSRALQAGLNPVTEKDGNVLIPVDETKLPKNDGNDDTADDEKSESM